jgi:predicted RNA-binding protein
MNYYLFITDEYNWKILQNKEFWPFKHKTKKIISSIDINDIFFIYLKPDFDS